MNVYGPLNENDRDRRILTVRKIQDYNITSKPMTTIASDHNKTDSSFFNKYLKT